MQVAIKNKSKNIILKLKKRFLYHKNIVKSFKISYSVIEKRGKSYHYHHKVDNFNKRFPRNLKKRIKKGFNDMDIESVENIYLLEKVNSIYKSLNSFIEKF